MPNNVPRKIVTQEDVARRAGVTRSIVSYVINNGPRKVSAETRQRVLDAIEELSYRPNKYAQILSSTDPSMADKYIGIILAGNYMFRRPYYGSVLASIHEHAHEIGWHVRFIRVFDDFSNPALFNELIHPNEIRNAILIGLDQVQLTADGKVLIDAIIRRVERVVCIEWEWPGIPSIHFDRQLAAFQATSHLLDCGRRRVAYIGPDDKRKAGYRQALWERGISPEEESVDFVPDATLGYAACEQLLRSALPVDAICAGTDEVSVGVLSCLHRHGLSVPGDVAVASIDNLEISEFTIPPLTTVDIPKHEFGRHAINFLASDTVWKSSAAFSVNLPTHLIVRETSAAKMKQSSGS